MSLWNDLDDPVFDGVALAGFKSRANAMLFNFSLSLLLSIGWYCKAGVFGLIGCISLSLSALHCRTLLIIIMITIIVPQLLLAVHTLSGSIGKVVASHVEGCKVARSNPGCG